MQNKNIIIGILLVVIMVGGIYTYLLSNRTVVFDDVEILPMGQFNYGTEIATTAPPYIAPEPDVTIENNNTQTGKIDEHLTIDPMLRAVNFCGNTYKVKQVMIDGVDVVQRIADIATKGEVAEDLKSGPFGPSLNEWNVVSIKKEEMASGICDSIRNSAVDGVLGIENVRKINFVDYAKVSQEIYVLSLVPVTYGVSFGITYVSKDIYSVSGFDGSFVGPIGKLK